MYDFVIVGSGFFGAVIAHELHKANKRVLVIEKRSHIGGNCYTENVDGIHVHAYGPHCFHTGDRRIWDYINQFAEFNNFTLRVKANYQGRLYSMPINLMTFQQVWGVTTPEEAKRVLEEKAVRVDHPSNFEEAALGQLGHELYSMFFQGYTTKQWGMSPELLPASIFKRLPIRANFNDRYYGDHQKWEGIPIGGYTRIFEKLLQGIDLITGDALSMNLFDMGKHVVYSGSIDEYFGYELGKLEYRSLTWETERLEMPDFQGCAQVNYTSMDVPYTRIIEHKHFEPSSQCDFTIISREYPAEHTRDNVPMYPVRTQRNIDLYQQYEDWANNHPNLTFGGRLGKYQYFNMDQTIANALSTAKFLLEKE